MSTTHRPLRADAARNREALICAARRCFATAGDAAQMDDIAAAARVGVGTLYRHFPTKDDLINALIEEQLRRFIELLEDDRSRDPWQRLTAVIGAMVREQCVNRSLARAACTAVQSDSTLRAIDDEMRTRLQGVIDEATRAGAVRPGIAADDVIAFCFNEHLAHRAERSEAFASMIVEGIRAR